MLFLDGEQLIIYCSTGSRLCIQSTYNQIQWHSNYQVDSDDNHVKQIAIVLRHSPKLCTLLALVTEHHIKHKYKMCIYVMLAAQQLLIYDILSKLEIDTRIYSTDLSQQEHDTVIKTFNEDPDQCHILLHSFCIFGHSLDLQCCPASYLNALKDVFLPATLTRLHKRRHRSYCAVHARLSHGKRQHAEVRESLCGVVHHAKGYACQNFGGDTKRESTGRAKSQRSTGRGISPTQVLIWSPAVCNRATPFLTTLTKTMRRALLSHLCKHGLVAMVSPSCWTGE